MSVTTNSNSKLESSIRHRAKYWRALRGSSGAQTPSVKVILIYEGLAGLARANQVWCRMAARLGGKIVIETSAWNFALLRGARLRDQAVSQAAEADVVVISPGADNILPEQVTNWVETWPPGERHLNTELENRVQAILAECLRQMADQGTVGVIWKPR